MQLAPSPREVLLQTYDLVRRGPISDDDLSAALKITHHVIRSNLRLLHAYEMVHVSSWVGRGDIEYPLWSVPAYPGQPDVPGTHPTSLSRVLKTARKDGLPTSKRTSISRKEAEAAARRKAERTQAAVAAAAERTAERLRKQAERAALKAAQTPAAIEARRQERMQTLVPPERRKTQWAFPIDFGART